MEMGSGTSIVFFVVFTMVIIGLLGGLYLRFASFGLE